MPLERLARARTTLPEGYQFGDARPHQHNFDDQLRCSCGALWPDPWNVIEGEHFDSDADRTPVIAGAPVTRSHGVRILDA